MPKTLLKTVLGGAGLAVTCRCAAQTKVPSKPTPAQVEPSPGPAGILSGSLRTLELPASRVAYLCACKPSVHNPGGGGPSRIYLGNYCGHSERFLFHWDLSDLPANAKLLKVVLRLYCLELHGSLSGSPLVALVEAAWGDEVTYATQPSWDSATAVRVDWPAGSGWHEIDITAIARAWLAKPDASHGLVALAEKMGEGTGSAEYASVEAPPEARPRLVVTYSAEP